MEKKTDFLKNTMAVVGGKSMLSITAAVNRAIERDCLICSISVLLGVPFDQVDKATKIKPTSELERIKHKIATGEIKSIDTI